MTHQPNPILQDQLLDPPWAIANGSKLPGTSPIEAEDWVALDSAYSGQMALRDRLIEHEHKNVLACLPEALESARELLEDVLELLPAKSGFRIGSASVTRPDGAMVDLNFDQPLVTLGRLVQEDFCILQERGDEHAMTGAILCFPASWSLAEKIDRPLTGIHEPVTEYDDNIARRVQRLFNAIQVGRPIRRANCLLYNDFGLFQPRREDARRTRPTWNTAPFVRTERQCLFRLAKSKAVVFSIHTCVVQRSKMSGADLENLRLHLSRHQREVFS